MEKYHFCISSDSLFPHKSFSAKMSDDFIKRFEHLPVAKEKEIAALKVVIGKASNFQQLVDFLVKINEEELEEEEQVLRFADQHWGKTCALQIYAKDVLLWEHRVQIPCARELRLTLQNGVSMKFTCQIPKAKKAYSKKTKKSSRKSETE